MSSATGCATGSTHASGAGDECARRRSRPRDREPAGSSIRARTAPSGRGRRVSLAIAPGEIHAVVGESGAGKTTVANALIGLIEKPGRVAGGAMRIGGALLDPATGRGEGVQLGRDIGVVFQDPMTSLNPLFTIESQLTETMRFHLGLSQAEARARALELLKAVGIPEPERAAAVELSAPALGRSAPARRHRRGAFPASRSCWSQTSRRRRSMSRSRRRS